MEDDKAGCKTEQHRARFDTPLDRALIEIENSGPRSVEEERIREAIRNRGGILVEQALRACCPVGNLSGYELIVELRVRR